MYVSPPYKNRFYVPVCFNFPMCSFQSTSSYATKQDSRPTRARAQQNTFFLVDNTFNARKSIKKRPCTILHAIFPISILTYLLIPWSRVLLEKLTGSAASQEIPRIFETRNLITVLTSARHLSLSWANSIQSPQPPPTSWSSILILSSHLRLGLPNGLFPSGFPTRTMCTPLPYANTSHMPCPTHSSRFYHSHNIR
jgi:hypothetical protein